MRFRNGFTLIYTSAYAINGWLSKENITRLPHPAEVLVAHDHVEPRLENGNRAWILTIPAAALISALAYLLAGRFLTSVP